MSDYFMKPIVKILMLKGQEGQSIKGIEKTSTDGLVDTYTITFNDGTTSTFTVTNGDSKYKPAVEALGKRIDNLILSSGTESSAEVVDARTGYDGEVYDTVGTAIRTQVSELKSDIDELNAYAYEISNNLLNPSECIKDYQSNNWSGQTYNDISQRSGYDLSGIIPIESSTDYCMIDQNGVLTRGYVEIFYDQDGNWLGTETVTDTNKPYATTPENAKYLRINTNSINYPMSNGLWGFIKKQEDTSFKPYGKEFILINKQEINTFKENINEKLNNVMKTNETGRLLGFRQNEFEEKELPCDLNVIRYKYVKDDNGVIAESDLQYGIYGIYNIPNDNNLEVYVTTYGRTSDISYPVIFTDAENNIIGKDNCGITTSSWVIVNNYKVVVPSGAKKMYLSSGNTDYFALKTKEMYIQINKNNIGNEYQLWLDNLNKTTLNRITAIEKQNPFAWNSMDKGYFCFSFDDGKADLTDIASEFNSRDVPMMACIIVSDLYLSQKENDNTTLLETMKSIITHGGEILSHSIDADVFSSGMNKDIVENKFAMSKYLLAKNGINVRGFTKPGGTGSEGIYEYTDILRKYYQYGYSCSNVYEQFSPWRWDIESTSIEQLKAEVDKAVSNKTVVHLYCHNYTDKIGTLLDYIIAKGSENAEIVTYGTLFDKFASSKLEQRIKALENN